MELQLKNIGMIKEANVKIDGLTVIAGENDTGKSTVGKALYLQLKAFSYKKTLFDCENSVISSISNYMQILFKNSIKGDAKIQLNTKKNSYVSIFIDGDIREVKCKSDFKETYTPIFIESPLVWNLQEFFRSLSDIESHLKITGENIDIPYPFLMKDLYFKLVTSLDVKVGFKEGLLKKIKDIINGEFKKASSGIYIYTKKNDKKNYDLINTATGIKSFAILQVLLHNNRLNKDTILIFDEPEVHLHPKWQLEMAKILVELAANGVRIVVNSHSPYMIEALERYSKIEPKTKDKTNFYLAEDGFIKQIEDSNSLTLEKIFSKLSEPFEVFEEMDSESLEKLING